MKTIAACDIDLLRIHAWSNHLGRICYNADSWPLVQLAQHETILIEIATAQDTGTRKEAYNRRRWAIGNSFQLGRFAVLAESMIINGSERLIDRVLVSPSTKWTMNHPEPVREAAAGCAGEDNHDIRACRCMIFYYQKNPDKWTPLRTWMSSPKEQI